VDGVVGLITFVSGPTVAGPMGFGQQQQGYGQQQPGYGPQPGYGQQQYGSQPMYVQSQSRPGGGMGAGGGLLGKSDELISTGTSSLRDSSSFVGRSLSVLSALRVQGVRIILPWSNG